MKREALIKYHKGNLVKVMKYMDIDAEERLLAIYTDWVHDMTSGIM